MKQIFILLISILLVQSIYPQAPNKFRYQAVTRDQSGAVITGTVSVRLSFLEDVSNGPVIYSEEHTVTTNSQGVFDLTINEGSLVTGDKELIDYANHQYWLKVELKTPLDAGYTEMGITQLQSVPYAMYAAKAGSDLAAGTGISITNDKINNTGDLSTTNEIQSLSLNGNQLAISNGNTVTLPTGTTYTEGPGIQINGNTISAEDQSDENELQTLSLNGNQLSISDGNSVNLPVNNYTAGSGIQINGNAITALDANPTNEIQILSLNGQQLSLSNGGGSIQLPSGGSSSWALNNTEITSTPTTNNVVIGSTNNFNSKLYVSASGTQHGGNFYAPTTGNALNAYCNGTGAGISSSSLSGPGARFSSASGPGLLVDAGNVGIGTTTPAKKLTVVAGNSGGIYASANNAYAIESTTTGTVPAGYFHSAEAIGATFSSTYNYCIQALQGQAGVPASDQGILVQYANDRWKMYVDLSHDYSFGYNNTPKAWISSTDGSYHMWSDRALKKNIQAFSDVLPRLSKLQAYTYQMKTAPDDSPPSVGFMAQDVAEQFPQLVIEKDGYKSICYDHFAVLSVEAIKEQQLRITDLEKKLEVMNAMVIALTEKIQSLADFHP